PFFGKVADALAQRLPDLELMLAKSDFLSIEFLKNIPDVVDGRPLEGDNLTWEERGIAASLITTGGVRIQVATPAEVAASAALALTLPGSVTAELAALGIPMVVVLPTGWGEVATLPGLAEYVGRAPVVGKYIKRAVRNRYLRSLKYVAHPNRRAMRMI